MSSLDERMQQSQAALQRWEQELGFPACRDTCPVDTAGIDLILSLERKRLAERSARQAAEYAFVLAQFAFYVQRRVNRCHASIRRARPPGPWCSVSSEL